MLVQFNVISLRKTPEQLDTEPRMFFLFLSPLGVVCGSKHWVHASAQMNIPKVTHIPFSESWDSFKKPPST